MYKRVSAYLVEKQTILVYIIVESWLAESWLVKTMDYSNKLIRFQSIPAEPNKNSILRRMKYKKNTTTLSIEDEKMINLGIQKGLSLCHLKGIYGRFPIFNRGEDFVELKDGIRLDSQSLSKLLNSSEEVVLMASTVGEEVVNEVSNEIKHGNPALGVVMDATASETADVGLDWIMRYINTVIRREGRRLTKHRYSPGYGDLPLENQKIIYKLLELDKMEISITERYMLVPEKSVLAIAGIERNKADE